MALGKLAKAVGSVALAVGALSVAWQVAQKWRQKRKRGSQAPTSPDAASKKRPHSEASSPEPFKRPRQDEASSLQPSEGAKAGGTRPGSVTDTSALLAAKIAVPDKDQSDPEKLGRHYEAMAAKFEKGGLNLSAVTDGGKFYKVEGGSGQPLAYADFETPFARGAVRLGVFRLTDSNSAELATAASRATRDILGKLPEGLLVHSNEQQHYHVTVQMISHPSDPRPNAFAAGGGFDKAAPPNPIPAPLPASLEKERRLYAAVAAAGQRPKLLVHSVVMADSGALLLLFTEANGAVQSLRRKLEQAFPGAAAKQPSILHVTLARLLSPEQLSQQQRRAVVSACERWTQELRGAVFEPDSLWHVQENTFTYVNVDETSERCPIGQSSSSEGNTE